MSELSLPELKVEITADATNALDVIQATIEALTALQAAADRAAEVISYTEAETQAAMNAIEGAGVSIDEASKELLTSAPELIGQLAAAIESGDSGQIQAALDAALSALTWNVDLAGAEDQGDAMGSALMDGASTAVSEDANLVSDAANQAASSAGRSAAARATSAGRPIGTNLISGARSGVVSAVESLVNAVRSAVRSAIDAAKEEADIHSPSGVAEREIGSPIMQGVETGIVRRAPTTLQVIQGSMRGLISGATAVVSGSGIPAPAMAIPMPGGTAIDYELLADAISRRPAYFHVGEKQLAVATRDEAARQQAVRVAQINAGYGGR